MTGSGRIAVHASALVLGETGLLIRGDSGSGKSTLLLGLLQWAQNQGKYAALVGDDRLFLHKVAGRLMAEPHPVVAGRLEVRGLGIVPILYENRAVIRGVIDLIETFPSRLPLPEEVQAQFFGIEIARIAVSRQQSCSVTLQKIVLWMEQNRTKHGRYEKF